MGIYATDMSPGAIQLLVSTAYALVPDGKLGRYFTLKDVDL